jgi:nucleoside-diphosphate-sugar epimerase
MAVLIIGGSGYVGGMVTPLLRQRFTPRIFDLRPPSGESGYVHGDATDYPALLAAMAGVDAIVHCAMNPVEGTESGIAAAASRSITILCRGGSMSPSSRMPATSTG